MSLDLLSSCHPIIITPGNPRCNNIYNLKVYGKCWLKQNGIVERKNQTLERCTVIAQVVGWAKPDPNHNMATTRRIPIHCHLR
jgi:hypothetical protein